MTSGNLQAAADRLSRNAAYRAPSDPANHNAPVLSHTGAFWKISIGDLEKLSFRPKSALRMSIFS